MCPELDVAVKTYLGSNLLNIIGVGEPVAPAIIRSASSLMETSRNTLPQILSFYAVNANGNPASICATSGNQVDVVLEFYIDKH